jgi:hypothetical protein
MKKLVIAISFVLWVSQSFALTNEEKGLEIIQEVDRWDTGFGDSKADLKMILRNSNGDE